MKDVKVPKYDDWTYAFHCDRCGTEAVGEVGDLSTAIKTSGYIFADTLRSDRVFYFACPNAFCASDVLIDAAQIPEGLKLQVSQS